MSDTTNVGLTQYTDSGRQRTISSPPDAGFNPAMYPPFRSSAEKPASYVAVGSLNALPPCRVWTPLASLLLAPWAPGGSDLERCWRNPPLAARPHTNWLWQNGYVDLRTA